MVYPLYKLVLKVIDDDTDELGGGVVGMDGNRVGLCRLRLDRLKG
jgi:hypothetical protein